MAILSDTVLATMRQKLHGDGLALLQAESPPLSKAEIKAAVQAIEDYWETNRANIKANIDAAVGRTISVALAKKLGKYWLQYKWGLE